MDEKNVLEVQGGQAFNVASEGMFTLTHVIYALHAVAVAIGLFGAATIVGSFVSGAPSIVAVILNYLNRGAVRGTVLESHFRWQIRTFWFALMWAIMMGILIFTFIGIPFAMVGLVIVGVWVTYRVVRGWLALGNRKPMPY